MRLCNSNYSIAMLEGTMDVAEEKAIHHNIMIAFMSLNIVIFSLLIFKVRAPYGRYTGSVKGFDLLPSFNSTIAWIIQEIPCLLIPFYNYFLSPTRNPEALSSISNNILLFLFVFHYTNRALIYPFTLTKASKFPGLVLFLGVFYTCLHGYIQSRELCVFTVYPDDWIYSPRFIIGVSIFFLGFYWNNQADRILRNLRKPGETEYKIPRGGMFEYVSGANYFAETLEWFGYFLACSNLASLSYFVATFANIVPRAVSHHEWYLQTFKDKYPKNRKAVIPFIW